MTKLGSTRRKMWVKRLMKSLEMASSRIFFSVMVNGSSACDWTKRDIFLAMAALSSWRGSVVIAGLGILKRGLEGGTNTLGITLIRSAVGRLWNADITLGRVMVGRATLGRLRLTETAGKMLIRAPLLNDGHSRNV